MTGIIWGRTQERANEELERVRDQYLAYGKVLSYIRKDGFGTQDGDCWKAVKANDSARGYLCNISYIDKTIPEDIIKQESFLLQEVILIKLLNTLIYNIWNIN